MDRTTQFLKSLTEAHGVPGFEHDVADVMAAHLKGVGKLSRDRLGSLICEKIGDPKGPRVLMAGHLDEVGFLVKSVTKEGFVKFLPLGGWWGHVVLGQRLILKTRKGDVVGVVGSRPPHELRDEDRKKVLEIKDMYIDVGGTSDWDVRKKLDIRPGDPIVPDSPFTQLANPNALLAKAWDNRIGCALAAETARRLQGTKHPNILYAAATVQEEVGLRGAQTTATKVKPDVAFALDVGIAHDTPGTEGDEQPGRRAAHRGVRRERDPEPQAARPGRRHGEGPAHGRAIRDRRARRHRRRPLSHARRGRAQPVDGRGRALHPQPREHHRQARLRAHRAAAGGGREEARPPHGGSPRLSGSRRAHCPCASTTR